MEARKRRLSYVIMKKIIAVLIVLLVTAQTSFGASQGRIVFDSSMTRFLYFSSGTTTSGPGTADNSKYISNIASWLDNGNKKILIYMSYQDTANVPESKLVSLLNSLGYSTDVRYRSGEDITSSLLSGYGQVWFIDNSLLDINPQISQAEKDAVLNYYQNNGRIVLTGETGCDGSGPGPFRFMVGNIAPVFNVAMTDCLDTTSVELANNIIKPAFTSHPVVSGLATVSNTDSDLKIVSNNPNTVVVATVMSQPYILVLDGGGGTTTTTTGSTTTTSGGATTTTGPSPTTTTPGNTPVKDIIKRVNEIICTLFTLIIDVSVGIAVIMIILAGVKYLTSDAPDETSKAKNMIVYAFMGLVLVLIACPLVDYLVASTKITPFEKTCNCLILNPPVNGTTTTTNGPGTTTTTGPGPTTPQYLTAKNLVACINKAGALHTGMVGCPQCSKIEYIFNETTLPPIGPGRPAYLALNKMGITGSPCGGIPCWVFGSTHQGGCMTFKELNTFYNCGLTPYTDPYICCDGTASTTC